MKKILTVSLFAVMAVSAAHAKIASVEYVDPKFQAINKEIGDVVYTGGSLTAAISALQTDVGAMSGTGEGSVSKQIESAKNAAIEAAALDAAKYIDEDELNASQTAQNTTLESYADTAAAGAVTIANTYTDGKIGTLGESTNVVAYVNAQVQSVSDTVGDASDTLNQLVIVDQDGQATAPGEFLQQYVEGTVSGLYVNKVTADDGKYFNAYAEADGKISMEQKAFETTIAADVANAPTTDAVYEAIEAAKNAGKTDLENIDSEHAVEANKFVTGMTQVDGVITQVTKSSIDAAVVALASVPAECGTNGTNKCALSVKNGTFTWEIIEE